MLLDKVTHGLGGICYILFIKAYIIPTFSKHKK